MDLFDQPLFIAIFNTDVPRIVLKTDAPNFTIVACNDAYRTATNTHGRDIRGRFLWDAFAPKEAGGDGRRILLNALIRATDSNASVHMPPFHYDIPSEDESRMEKSWWQLEIVPVAGSDGKPEYLLTTTYNVTDRILSKTVIDESGRREEQLSHELAAINEELNAANEELMTTIEELQQSQTELMLLNDELEDRIVRRTNALAEKNRELTFLADSIPSIVWTSDPEGKLDYINHRWYERNPASDKLPLGTSWINNLHPDDIEPVRQAWSESINTGKPYEIEFRILNADGNYHWYLVRALPMRDETGKIIKWYGNNTDIQQQKDLQQQKDDFITIASHELKTPITSLKASLQLLDKIKDNPSSGIMPRLIMQSRKSMEKISNLVDDLLNVRRLQEGQLTLNKTLFTLSELVNTICNPISIGGKHKISILGNKELQVYADEHRIDQVITNFVNNAVKYAPESDIITLTIEQEADMVKLSVSDNGPGIAPDKLPHIFKRYYRSDYSGQQYSGLGLGLYISSEIIKRHNGAIGADSVVGEGSVFWFKIPLS